MNQSKKLWGILGGMGPLSSAEFLKTIYLSSDATQDQDFPIVFLLSDPKFPDRTTALRTGNEEALLERLTGALDTLISAGCTDLVICCMTIHALIPKLRPDLQAAIVSLAELLLREVSARRGDYLLLCSEGTRETRLFESHPLWSRAADRIVLPDEADQQDIHRMIYEIKAKPCTDSVSAMVWRLMEKYHADSFAVGCSEVHMMARYMEQQNTLPSVPCIDPFAWIARAISSSTGPAAFATAEAAQQV